MRFSNIFSRFATQKPNLGGLPVKRVSVPEDTASVLGNYGSQDYSFVMPKKWPLEIYDVMLDLTLTNPDLRQAVGHIVNLGNTGHILGVNGDSDVAIESAVKRIEDNADQVFPYSGGPDGLINALFAQIARMGATSTEWVPKNDLSGVDKVFLVPVGQIRWVPRKNFMGYYPVQTPKNMMAMIGAPTFIKLNERTYHYANLEALEDSPYAVPMFLAAIKPVTLQRAMVENLHKIIRKLGILGLCSYKVEPPPQKPGESQEKYHARCKVYLAEVVEDIKKGFGDGIAAGFKGAFEFDVASVTGDARGVSDIFKMNEEQLFSAIGADPAMHGRTYSTTETYASVVYSKMISQLQNIQRMVAHSLEFGWNLDLLMAGNSAGINVTFKSSNALSNLQEAQAEMIDIANAEALYMGGVIDQNEKARRLGYEYPDQAEPRMDPNAKDKNLDQRPKTGGGTDNTQKNVKKKQPKEQTSVKFVFDQAMKRYYHAPDAPLVINTASAQMFADEHDKEPDPELEAKFRRYLRRASTKIQ
jgi:hypothetical protein